MRLAALSLPPLDNSYARAVGDLSVACQAAEVPDPRLIALNEPLARDLGVDPEALRSPEGVAVLAGNAVPETAQPTAQAYAGHQFGGLSPRLGDGRALLLGEVIDTSGDRRDLHMKGSGRTPFSRGGDGKAALGPMLREYVIGEAMHALGIPTSRALAVVATGERVMRDTGPLPGAVLMRVAASHLRVGTFQYAAMHHGPETVKRLADYAIARHHPAAAEADNPYLALFDAVIAVQAELIARWMQVGFIHGVMNTDNMTISGETIDYGPCAFMEAFDPATVFSSIDHGGRYAYGNQPVVAQWNLARLAESLLELIDADQDRAVAAATERLNSFTARCEEHWLAGMRAKLGFTDAHHDDAAFVAELLAWMRAEQADFTSFLRGLTGEQLPSGLRERWESRGPDRDLMDRSNPVYLPRNHLVEEALTAASEHDDLEPFERLLDAVNRPFDERPGFERHARPAPPDFGAYRTFCGT